MAYEHEPEPVDELYEAVFRTPEGLSVVTGIGVTALVGIPAIIASFAVPSPEGYKEQSAEIGQMQADVTALTPAFGTLAKSGDAELANGVHSKIDSLNQQIAIAEANLPSHTTTDVLNGTLLVVPFIAGALAGAMQYRRLKQR